jgi:hypothetical protein
MKQRRPLFILLLLLTGWLNCPLTDFFPGPTTSVVLASAGEPLDQDEPNAERMMNLGLATRRIPTASPFSKPLVQSLAGAAQQLLLGFSPAPAPLADWLFVQRAAAAPRAPSYDG